MSPADACAERDRFSRLCGLELISSGPGEARARMKLGRKHLNGLGCVHGGAIFSLADFAFAMAINSLGNMALAIQCSVTYLRPATEGSLWAEALEVSRTSKLGTYEVEVKNDAGELVARFQGLGYIKKEPVPLRVPRSFKRRRRIEARSAPRANPS